MALGMAKYPVGIGAINDTQRGSRAARSVQDTLMRHLTPAQDWLNIPTPSLTPLPRPTILTNDIGGVLNTVSHSRLSAVLDKTGFPKYTVNGQKTFAPTEHRIFTLTEKSSIPTLSTQDSPKALIYYQSYLSFPLSQLFQNQQLSWNATASTWTTTRGSKRRKAYCTPTLDSRNVSTNRSNNQSHSDFNTQPTKPTEFISMQPQPAEPTPPQLLLSWGILQLHPKIQSCSSESQSITS